MPQYPTAIDLEFLTLSTGLVFRSNQSADWFGLSVASVGDVNGDGVNDYMIGAPAWHVRENRPNPPVAAGNAYLVFGGASISTLDTADGGAADGILNLSFLTPSTGYRLSYGTIGDATGASLAGVGNVDGVAGNDFIIGSPGTVNGTATLISGGANLAALDAADGNVNGVIDLANATSNGGYRFTGRASGDRLGIDVNTASDINGDGTLDFLIGAHLADQTGASNGGEAALVFGGAANLAALDAADGTTDRSIAIANLNGGTRGYLLQGFVLGNAAGFRVEGIRDVNGDGISDIITGAYQTPGGGLGETYLVFGGTANLSALDTANATAADGRINLTAVNGTTGYRLVSADDGDQFGLTITSAGDVNGDGIGDILVGDPFSDPFTVANAGDAYLVFGGTANLAALDAADGVTDGTLDMDFLDGTTGYRFSGTGSEWLGQSVDAGGDIDGDGYDDIIIGANFRAGRAGAAYVFFGGGGLAIQDAADGVTDGRIRTSSFSGQAGFRMDGVDTLDQAGFSVAGLGDINGDHLGDVMIGSVRDQLTSTNNGDGEAYIVYSRLPDAAVSRTGNGIGQTLVGGAFNDTLAGLGGNDQLYANAGNDSLDGGIGNDLLEGGAGNDIINGGADIDTASYAGASSRVVVNLLIATAQNTLGAGTDTIINVENLTGSAFDDTLTGNNVANLLIGGLGNDLLNGRGGLDTMVGANGNDRYYVDAAGDIVTETAGQGTDRIYASVNYTLAAGVSVEYLTANAGNTGLALTGNDFSMILEGLGGNDTLTGGAGNDILTGRGGADLMVGGAGNDRYYVDNLGDVIVEGPSGGTLDLLYTSVDIALSDDVRIERIFATVNANLTLAGNAHANVINGSGGNDTLIGAAGADVLTAGAGNDYIDSGAGIDTVFGNAGNDVFALSNLAADRDTIRDFVSADDQFEINAVLFGGGLTPFQILTGLEFVANDTGLASDGGDGTTRFVYNTLNGALYFDIDGAGSTNRVQIATLTGKPLLTAEDFNFVGFIG
jgi:Ca2+-binding RTX toxin-like protein